ncbi:hypothetical protein N7468_009698 [Penicillium chermesinum]|uniref:Reticulon-like protein n=1 Tax=Penicillium chermesinum TaxID=63820 RepID=A0A9W9NKR0_9EURO|nr:uncharacterized protein N7468_009698 [Penicillium chermesinum]KAJ5220494.1 hypothetical protein N7468_009698 [Penicillium chermesinum]
MADSGDVSYPNTVCKYQSLLLVTFLAPVVDKINSEASKTTSELNDLKNSRVTPSTTTADGQPLTHYHSLLYSLLSVSFPNTLRAWEQPRATAVSFATVISFIFAARYLPILRWAFKFLYMSLGLTAAVEVAGRAVLKQGIASSFRPRRYYTISKETHEAVLEDVSQLSNFFLIEFQRILFAENVVHTVAAFFAAFTGYWLIRFVPLWGLALIAVTTAYIGPLVYISNREIIDEQIQNLQDLIAAQTNQLKDLAGEHTSHATGLVKQYVGDYSKQAQEYIGRRSASPEVAKAPAPAPAPAPVKSEPAAEPLIKTEDFPEAPKAEPQAQPVESVETEPEHLVAA